MVDIYPLNFNGYSETIQPRAVDGRCGTCIGRDGCIKLFQGDRETGASLADKWLGGCLEEVTGWLGGREGGRQLVPSITEGGHIFGP